jgi:predicted DNA-binding transcriptional regulator AlpA
MNINENDRAITEHEAAAILGLSVATLRAWRQRGIGPRFVKLGRRAVRYLPSEIQRFVVSNTVSPCADDSESAMKIDAN